MLKTATRDHRVIVHIFGAFRLNLYKRSGSTVCSRSLAVSLSPRGRRFWDILNLNIHIWY